MGEVAHIDAVSVGLTVEVGQGFLPRAGDNGLIRQKRVVRPAQMQPACADQNDDDGRESEQQQPDCIPGQRDDRVVLGNLKVRRMNGQFLP